MPGALQSFTLTDSGGALIASCQALAYRKDQPLPFGKE